MVLRSQPARTPSRNLVLSVPALAGEGGRLAYSGEMSRCQTRTPILISVPGVEAPATGVGGHIDVFPTIFDALGLRTKNTRTGSDFKLLPELDVSG
jgi:arylsulfatase A-like enzyme